MHQWRCGTRYTGNCKSRNCQTWNEKEVLNGENQIYMDIPIHHNREKKNAGPYGTAKTRGVGKVVLFTFPNWETLE